VSGRAKEEIRESGRQKVALAFALAAARDGDRRLRALV
jgi:hypothetical protein